MGKIRSGVYLLCVCCMLFVLAGCANNGSEASTESTAMHETETRQTEAEQSETKQSEKIKSDAFNKGINQKIKKDDITLSIPERWRYTSEDWGISVKPYGAVPVAFLIGQVPNAKAYDLSDNEMQKQAAESMIQFYGDYFDSCQMQCYTSSKVFTSDEKHVRNSLMIEVTFKAGSVTGEGTIALFYLNDQLWQYCLFQADKSAYDYLSDYYNIGQTIRGRHKDPDPVELSFNQYIENLIAAGIVISVQDEVTTQGGDCFICVNEGWDDLSCNMQQRFADDILSEIKSWAIERYQSEAVRITIQKEDGATVAQSTFAGNDIILK